MPRPCSQQLKWSKSGPKHSRYWMASRLSRQCRMGRSLVRFLSPYREFLLQLRRKSWHLLWVGWGEAGDGRCGEAVRAQIRAARRSGSTMARNHNARASCETRAPVTNVAIPLVHRPGDRPALPGTGPCAALNQKPLGYAPRRALSPIRRQAAALLHRPVAVWQHILRIIRSQLCPTVTIASGPDAP